MRPGQCARDRGELPGAIAEDEVRGVEHQAFPAAVEVRILGGVMARGDGDPGERAVDHLGRRRGRRIVSRVLTNPAFASLLATAKGSTNVPDYCALLLRLPRLPLPGVLARLPGDLLAQALVALPAPVLAQVLTGVPGQVLAEVLATLPEQALAQVLTALPAQPLSQVVGLLPASPQPAGAASLPDDEETARWQIVRKPDHSRRRKLQSAHRALGGE